MIFVNLVLYYSLNQVLKSVLSTDFPMVVMVSSSMEHDSSVELDHYQWLENNLGYNRAMWIAGQQAMVSLREICLLSGVRMTIKSAM